LIGYKREELIGKSFLKLKLLSLADIPKAAKLLAKNIRGQPTGPDEFVLNRKDNSKVIVEISTYPVKIKGKILALGIARDITERKQAKDVKNAKDELQMIMDSVPALIFYKDTEGRIIRANKMLSDDLKISVKDMVGKTTEELFPKEQAEKMRKDDKEVIVSGQPKRDIIESYDTPEGVRWAITDKIPYINKEGKVTGVIGLSKDITVQRKSEQKLKQTYQKLKKTMDAAIDTMSKIIEAKDPYTSGHQRRVCQLAVPLARELGLSPDKIEGIRIASLIHDIGKIGLPAEILSKPTRLTDIEFSLIKGHSQIGYDILKSIDFSYPIAQIVLQHHERLDGSGYPNNLKGDKIILEAKIIGVADVVEAMSSHRPYRPALGIDAALEEISKNKSIFYIPEIVDICLRLFKEKKFKFK
jgi:PAS domain S-box-containing protein